MTDEMDRYKTVLEKITILHGQMSELFDEAFVLIGKLQGDERAEAIALVQGLRASLYRRSAPGEAVTLVRGDEVLQPRRVIPLTVGDDRRPEWVSGDENFTKKFGEAP